MNKDLDERLVPDGEYRDALDIRVSSSEGSDVGAVENIKSNYMAVPTTKFAKTREYQITTNQINASRKSKGGIALGTYKDAITVGTFSDDVNKVIYNFVHKASNLSPVTFRVGQVTKTIYLGCISDVIFEHQAVNNKEYLNETPLVVDVYESRIKSKTQSTAKTIIVDDDSAIGIEDGVYTSYLPLGVREGMRVQLLNSDGVDQYGPENHIYVSRVRSNFSPGSVVITTTAQDVDNLPIVTSQMLDAGYHFKFTAERVLNFRDGTKEKELNNTPAIEGETSGLTLYNDLSYTPNKNIITGINLIDDILYFTDGRNEPKKISIKLFKNIHNAKYDEYGFSGDPFKSIVHHSAMGYPTDGGTLQAWYMAREHITVIKKNPIKSLSFEVQNRVREPEPIDGSNILYSNSVTSTVRRLIDGVTQPFNFEGVAVGSFNFYITADVQRVHWKVNDVIYLTGSTSGFSASVKVLETYSGSNEEYNTFKVKLIDLEAGYNEENVDPPFEFWVGTVKVKESIYEKDFISYAYRYKYIDGEYSCISPYTKTIFAPGLYKFDAKNGFNTGMLNTIKSIRIFDFIDQTIPDDAVEIEIIFKNNASTNAYSIKSIKRNSETWNLNSIRLDDELFGRTIPTDQLERPFDNVPKKAIAQEFSGNRLMFGNYTEGYNLFEPNSKRVIQPSIISNIESVPHNFSVQLDSENVVTGLLESDNFEYNPANPFSANPFITEDNEEAAFTKIESDGRCQWVFQNNVSLGDPHPAYLGHNILVPISNDTDLGNNWNSEKQYFQMPMDGSISVAGSTKANFSFHNSQGNSDSASIKLGLYYVNDQGEIIDSNPIAFVDGAGDAYPYNIIDSWDDDLYFKEFNFDFELDLNEGDKVAFFMRSNTPTLVYNSGNTTRRRIFNIKDFEFNIVAPDQTDNIVVSQGTESVKSMRTYSVGMVYLDRYGRESSVLIDDRENLFNSKDSCNKKNAISVRPLHTAPDWATHYKYFIKEFASEYYNLVMYKAYSNEGGENSLYAWLAFNSADRNKVKISDYLIQKKEHGGDDATLDEDAKWRVLDIVDNPTSTTDAEGETTFSIGNITLDATLADISGKFFVKIETDDVFVRTVGNITAVTDDQNVANGACFEVETKNNIDTDLFYEASQAYPIKISEREIENLIKTGAKVKLVRGSTHDDAFVDDFNSSNITVTSIVRTPVTSFGSSQVSEADNYSGSARIQVSQTKGLLPGTQIIIETKYGGSITMLLKKEFGDGLYYLYPYTHTCSGNGIWNSKVTLPWYNCFAFGNGVESDRIRDDFNENTIYPYIATGKASGFKASIPNDDYQEQTQENKIIFSQIKNEDANLNRTNEFLMAQPIVKSLNKEYGSIQKLYTRNDNVLSFCELKVLKILANKDALFNADGNAQLLSSTNVLGQAIPYGGDYGISKNPESFAVDEYRIYFADKNKGSICRLSMDGITVISDAGMKNWFNDNLETSASIIGAYDGKKNEYNVTIHSIVNPGVSKNVYTVSWSESVKGWTSFRSYIMERSAQISNNYYTFKNGFPFIHDHDLTEDKPFFIAGDYHQDFRTGSLPGLSPSSPKYATHDTTSTNYGRFYGNVYYPSVTVLFNDQASIVKRFPYINYEGTQAGIDKNIADDNYVNLVSRQGWLISSVETDQQQAKVSNFVDKEGKWFNYFQGKLTTYTNKKDGGVGADSNLDFSEDSVIGIGKISTIAVLDGGTTPTEGYNVALSANDED